MSHHSSDSLHDPEIRNQKRESASLPLFNKVSSEDERCQALRLASRQNDREIHPLAPKAQLADCADRDGHLAFNGTSPSLSQVQQ